MADDFFVIVCGGSLGVGMMIVLALVGASNGAQIVGGILVGFVAGWLINEMVVNYRKHRLATDRNGDTLSSSRDSKEE
jgi:hypothetical protein